MIKVKLIAAAVLCPTIFLFTGCSVHLPGTGGTTTNNPPLTGIPATIDTVTANVVGVGLQFYAGQHPDTANAIATQIQSIVGATILPYLNGANGLSTSVVDGVLKQNFVNLPPEIQALISTAAAILDAYVPAPSASIIDANTLSYLKGFFQGLNDGATSFLGNGVKKVQRGQTLEVKHGRWLNFLPPVAVAPAPADKSVKK